MSHLPSVYLVRHGETQWSLSRQHTGRTDIPLTANGERQARRLGARLQNLPSTTVFTSPLRRARDTCNLVGLGDAAIVDDDLMEWDYGEYEGLKTAEIRRERPHWNVFVDGCPGGESARDIGARTLRAIERIRGVDGDAMVFAHGHLLRVFVACWLGLPPAEGRRFELSTASLSIVGYEHDRDAPVVRLWNDQSHLDG